MSAKERARCVKLRSGRTLTWRLPSDFEDFFVVFGVTLQTVDSPQLSDRQKMEGRDAEVHWAHVSVDTVRGMSVLKSVNVVKHE